MTSLLRIHGPLRTALLSAAVLLPSAAADEPPLSADVMGWLAEVFSHLMANAAHVEERARTDPVIRAKVLRMKQLLAAFCPDVNEGFWQKVREFKRAGK
jgi:hypothetical protein